MLRLRGGVKQPHTNTLTDPDYIALTYPRSTQKKLTPTISTASYKRSILAEIIPIAIHRATDPAVMRKCWALLGIHPFNPLVVLQQLDDGPPYVVTNSGINIAGKLLTDDKVLDDIIQSEQKRKKKLIDHDQREPNTIVVQSTSSSSQHLPSSSSIQKYTQLPPYYVAFPGLGAAPSPFSTVKSFSQHALQVSSPQPPATIPQPSSVQLDSNKLQTSEYDEEVRMNRFHIVAQLKTQAADEIECTNNVCFLLCIDILVPHSHYP